jgi:hypothetical protein
MASSPPGAANKMSINEPHPIDYFHLSAATREYGEQYTNSRPNSPAKSPKLLRSIFDDQGLMSSDVECIFRVRISGIQCRNLESRKFSGKSDPFVEFYWDDIPVPFTTPIIKGDLNPTFKGVTIAFEYKQSISLLKEKKLSVKVFSNRTFQNKTLIGSAVVDLLTVAAGPVHHDHHLTGCVNGRVVFNCYMEQCNHWTICVSDVGLMMPAMGNELDRPEGHDFQEDSSLPLKKYAVSYKCTIGTSETFHMGNTLKHAERVPFEKVEQISFQALARLKVLASRSMSRSIASHEDPSTNVNVSGCVPPAPSSNDHNAAVLEEPISVVWTSAMDNLPPITRYSTFDELMSATLKLEVKKKSPLFFCIVLSVVHPTSMRESDVEAIDINIYIDDIIFIHSVVEPSCVCMRRFVICPLDVAKCLPILTMAFCSCMTSTRKKWYVCVLLRLCVQPCMSLIVSCFQPFIIDEIE